MAKKNMKAIPTEPRAPRPPGTPTLPPGGPAEVEPGRQALERVRRFLGGKETLAGVYGVNWYHLAQADLHHLRTSREFSVYNHQESVRLSGISAGMQAVWIQSQIDALLPPKQKRFRPVPGRPVLEI